MKVEVEVEVGRQRCGPCEMWEFLQLAPLPSGQHKEAHRGEKQSPVPQGFPAHAALLPWCRGRAG